MLRLLHGRGPRLEAVALMVLACVGSLSVPLNAQQFTHVDPLFFSKAFGGANPLPQVLTITGAGSAFGFNASASTSSGGDWLAVSPTEDCCMTPAPVSVIVNAGATLEPGTYSGEVVFTSAGTSLIVNVTLVVVPSGGAVFDNTPGQLSFSMKPGGQAPSQVIQIGNGGTGTLNWRLIGSTFNGADFLNVSAHAGTAPTLITLGVSPGSLPNGGAAAGVYTGQLLFLAEGSTVTVPVRVSVRDSELDRMNAPTFANTSPGAQASSLAGGANLWPANTLNVVCGGFGNINTGIGGFTTAPDGTNTAQLIFEANPANGVAPHYEYLFPDLGVGLQTLSFHFKAGANSWVYIRSRVDGVEQRVWFNLQGAGAVGSNVPAGWTAQITSLAGGWYRCSVTFNVTQSAIFSGFGLATSDQQVNYMASDGNGIYQWGQQFEHGTLSAYQANVGPCLNFSKTADASSVAAGLPIGYTIVLSNNAAPGTGAATAAALNDPLPSGTGINWSISPTYGGPGTCAITGAVGSQALSCNLGDLAGGGSATVRVASSTSTLSCATYSNTATASAANITSMQAGATTTAQCTSLNSPTPGTVLSATSVTFAWSSTAGADQYWLDVGTSPGIGDLSAGATTNTSVAVTGLPCDGRTLYVQLFTHVNSTWQIPQRYTYTAVTGCFARIISPVPLTNISATSTVFTWNAFAGADLYWLDVGSSPGSGGISAGATASTSLAVAGLPCDGRTLFVQLYTHINSIWQVPQRYTYTAFTGCATALAQISSPAPLTTLAATSVTFVWSGAAGADQYWLDVGLIPGDGGISAGATTVTSKTVTGLPCDGRTLYVQLYTHINSTWQVPQRYTYSAFAGCGPALAQIVSPPASTTLSATTATFMWNAAAGADQYWLDVGSSVGDGGISAGATTITSKTVAGLPCDGRTLYVQLYTHVSGTWQVPQRYTYTAFTGCATALAQISSPAPLTTLSATSVTFVWSGAAGADQYWLDVGLSPGDGGISAGATTVTSKTVTGLPCDGRTLYVQLYTHINSTWQVPQRYTYTANSGCVSALAQIISPVPLTTLSATSATFTWNAVAGADLYWLDVGSIPANGGIFAGAIASTSQSVTVLPCDGRTLYVQLYTHFSTGWQVPQRYTYTAASSCTASLAQIISPAPLTTLSSTSVTFTWNAVTAADQYWLDVGSIPGNGGISAGATTSTSKAIAGLPCDGRALYVQLYTHFSAGWQVPQRYTYTAPPVCTP